MIQSQPDHVVSDVFSAGDMRVSIERRLRSIVDKVWK
jgi:hypothetical protein